MHPGLIAYLDWKRKVTEDLRSAGDNGILRFPGKIAVVEINNVEVLDSMQARSPSQSVPDGVVKCARNEPGIGRFSSELLQPMQLISLHRTFHHHLLKYMPLH